MSIDTKTGGPAFPETQEQHAWFPGMTLRDYFAAKAMQGVLSGDDVVHDIHKCAAWTYKIADAMLAERNK